MESTMDATRTNHFKSHDRILRGLGLACAAAVVYGLLIVLGF